MKARIILIFLIIFLSGCGNQADIDGIKKKFTENKESFEQLYIMIKKDTKVSSCFAVGIDHIGDYWEYDNKWNTAQNNDRKISLRQVLKEVGLSRRRYQEYISLFKKTGSERIEYCQKTPSWVRIIVHSSGLAVSGCLTSVNIHGDGSIPATKIKPGYSSEITPLGDGWYINHDCN